MESSNAHVPPKRRTHEKTYLKNKSDWHIIGNRFSANVNCIKCGKCASVCPSGNISVTENGVKFGDKCVACLGCYHRCPQKAITYCGKRKKDRYLNPFITESELGRDSE